MDEPLIVTLVAKPSELLGWRHWKAMADFRAGIRAQVLEASELKVAGISRAIVGTAFTGGVISTAEVAAALPSVAATLQAAAGLAKSWLIPLSPAVGPTLSALAGAWLHGRYGRKVRIKIGDIEAEASSAAEVDRLLEKAMQVRDRLKGEGE